MNIRQYEKCKELYENVRDDTKSIIGYKVYQKNMKNVRNDINNLKISMKNIRNDTKKIRIK